MSNLNATFCSGIIYKFGRFVFSSYLCKKEIIFMYQHLNITMKSIILTILLTINICSYAQYQTTKNTIRYTITGEPNLARLVSVLPVPVSNEYQEVKNLHVSEGKIYSIDDGATSILISDRKNDFKNVKDGFEVYELFDVAPKTVHIDFDKIGELYAYDTNSLIYKNFTGKALPEIDPTNARITKIGDEIWRESTDILDYAKKCYEYVAKNFVYQAGSNQLDVLLDHNGGDCGGFSAIYVNLLRYKKIPSRMVAIVYLDGGTHVWCEFYLEKYGWIPVDPTYKNGNPNKNYFGEYEGNGIIMSRGMNNNLSFALDFLSDNITFLQTCCWWYWIYDSPYGSGISADWKLVPYENTSIKDIVESKNYTQCFDLLGRKRSNNTQGLYIIKTTSGKVIKAFK